MQVQFDSDLKKLRELESDNTYYNKESHICIFWKSNIWYQKHTSNYLSNVRGYFNLEGTTQVQIKSIFMLLVQNVQLYLWHTQIAHDAP